ncbi:hypothetical protein [Halosimplex pelagicum]|uniref:Uncharacterized protein n=1 Tax=Halosimplex pelagicum TaxID=869886 RepID=A0A7D5P901_9EURY|nr:hypothetical protein [Halosimplex pelagicum]QLH82241.1 hypothetical protein HZS54_11750 [Halosimplex pelagicum]
MNDERKIEILKALMDESLWNLVSVEMDKGDGVLLYESGASRVDGEPAIEIPHEDPYLVDESTRQDPFTGEEENVPGVSPPPKTFKELLSEYGCLTKSRSGFTYVIVDEDVASKRP